MKKTGFAGFQQEAGFSRKKPLWVLYAGGMQYFSWKIIWSIKVPAKVIFAWTVALGKILKMDITHEGGI